MEQCAPHSVAISKLFKGQVDRPLMDRPRYSVICGCSRDLANRRRPNPNWGLVGETTDALLRFCFGSGLSDSISERQRH